jgi:hypothetical protein
MEQPLQRGRVDVFYLKVNTPPVLVKGLLKPGAGVKHEYVHVLQGAFVIISQRTKILIYLKYMFPRVMNSLVTQW